MKVKDIRGMQVEELKSKMVDLQRELNIELSMKSSAGGKSKNYGKIRTLKRTVARMLTFARLRELGKFGAAAIVEKKTTKPKSAKALTPIKSEKK